ncbi:MAG: hypothetical protein ABIV13_01325 [Fimbriimonadales bacterium]
MNETPDWGAYLAGELETDERSRINSLVENDQAARQELEGFKAFQATMREVGQNEAVPLHKLEKTLSHIAKQKRRSPVLSYAIAACLLIAICYAGLKAITYDAMELATTPTTEQIPTKNPQQAKDWVYANTLMQTPVIDLTEAAPIVGARYGEGWACYDYEVDGNAYYLYMSRATESIEKGTPDTINGRTVYRGRGIGWIEGNLAYYIKGGEDDTRELLAERARAATEN